MLRDGTADLFTWYDCVGNSSGPCNESDSLELVAQDATAASQVGEVFQPSQVAVHIPDPEGRTISSASGSTALVWSTGFANFTNLPGGQARSGVVIHDKPEGLDKTQWGVDSTNFPGYQVGDLSVDVSGPGEMSVWYEDSANPTEFWAAATDGNMYSGEWFIEFGYAVYAEFSKLGTYELTLVVKAAHSGGNGDCDTDGDNTNDGFCDTETYTFHVGPLTDLNVAGGSDAAAGQTAFTIRAANNGPENSADATVKIVLPSGALVEDHVASEGTYSNGVWTLPGLKLRDYRRSQGKPEAATLTLILKEGGGVPQEPATATISLTDNSYNVCIASDRSTLDHDTQSDCKDDAETTNTWHTAVCVKDADQTINTSGTHNTQALCTALTGHTWTANVCASSAGKVIANRTEAECDGWHTGTVYEYNAANNTAKITAAKGTGGGGPGAPGTPSASSNSRSFTLSWGAVPHVNTIPVGHYEVQKYFVEVQHWETVSGPVADTRWTDFNVGSGPMSSPYRVRAVNLAGVAGPWSAVASPASHRQASPPLNVTAVGGAGEVVVSWEPPTNDGGAPITYYQVQWSRSGTGGWSNACRSNSAVDLSCTATGIPAGETRYYRVAAYASGLGAWSDLAVATAAASVPSAPRSLSASRAPQDLDGETILAIRLTWSAPATDNGSPIYRYDLEYVDYDQSAGRCGTDWQYLGSDPSVHSNDPPTREFIDTGEYEWVGLEPGAHRCYRVQAVNSAGAGAWSNVASANAGGAVPPEWVYLDGEADGQNAITLFWGEPYYDGGAPVTSYQLQYSDGTTDSNGEYVWRNLTSTSGSARSYTHTGRKVGETWHYRIRARNSAGWSEWSYPISVTIEAGATANIAQPSLTARATSSTEVLLSWNSLCNPNKEDDCENKGIDGYMVEHSEDGGAYGWETLTWFWTDQTKFLDSAVEPGATRYYRVAGYQEVDRRQLFGRWSQAKSVTTVDFVVGGPQNFAITAEGERGLKLVWDEVTDGRDASSITGYRIERNTCCSDGTENFDTSWVARQTNHKNTTYVDTGLTPGTNYYYRVAAVTRNGSVPWIGPYSDTEMFYIRQPGG